MNQNSQKQLSLDLYSVGLQASPPYATAFLDKKDQGSRSDILLAHLKDLAQRVENGEIKLEESYKTKAQLAEILFPTEWAASSSKPEFERFGNEIINPRKMYRDKLIEKTSAAMRHHSKKIRDELKKCKNNKERSLFIKNLKMFVRVDSGDNDEFLFSYYGVGVRQNPAILQLNWEFMQLHSVKQDTERLLAETIYKLETGQNPTGWPIKKIDPNFIPQEEDFDINREDFNGLEEG